MASSARMSERDKNKFLHFNASQSYLKSIALHSKAFITFFSSSIIPDTMRTFIAESFSIFY